MLFVILVFVVALVAGTVLSDGILRAGRLPQLAKLAAANGPRAALLGVMALMAVGLAFHLYSFELGLGLIALAGLAAVIVGSLAGRAGRSFPEAAGQTLLAALALGLLLTEGTLALAARGHAPARYAAELSDLVGRRSVPVLTAGVLYPDPEVRISSLNHLAQYAPQGLEAVAVAADDPNAGVCILAIGLLSQHPEPYVDVLARHAMDPESGIRGSARTGLQSAAFKLGDVQLKQPTPDETYTRIAAAFLEGIADTPGYKESSSVRSTLRNILASSPFVTQGVVRCFHGNAPGCPSDPAVRCAAAEMLCYARGPDGLQSIMQEAVQDPAPEARAGLARGLGDIIHDARNEQAREWESIWSFQPVMYEGQNDASRPDAKPLVRALARLLRDRDHNVRLAAATSLTNAMEVNYMSGGKSINPLNPDSRMQAITLPEVRAAAVPALSDRDPEVRLGAAKVLAEMRDRRAIPVLEAADLQSTRPKACEVCSYLSILGVQNLRHTPYPNYRGR